MSGSVCEDNINNFLYLQIEFVNELLNGHSKKDERFIISSVLEKIGYLDALLMKKDYEIIKDLNTIQLLRKRKTFSQKLLNQKKLLEEICAKLKNANIPCKFSNEDYRPLIIATIVKNYVDTYLLPLLKEKNVEDLIINPHLFTLLGFKKINTERDLEALIRFALMQLLTRSLVTSWGNFVEKLLFYSGKNVKLKKDFKQSAEYLMIKSILEKKSKKKLKGANFDLLKIKEKKFIKKCYWIQVKSGPNTVNLQMAKDFIELFTLLKKQMPKNHRFILGLTYGNEKLLSNQTKEFQKNKILILAGRKFWDCLAEKAGFYKLVFDILELINSIYVDFDIFEYFEKLIQKLKKEWIEKYGLNADITQIFM
jgi:hypothetical protein